MPKRIRKAGLLVVRDTHILLCRKNRDTSQLITPGGKFELGENSEACIRREIAEEFGAGVSAVNLRFVGTYADEAAGLPDTQVEVELWQGELTGEPSPQAEIAEIVWFAPGIDDPSRLSPTLRRQIIPDLIRRRLLPG